MRCDQYIGLNARAEALLRTKSPCDKCGAGGGADHIRGGYSASGFGETPLLGGFLQDGTIVYEKVQIEPWSSGPMFFTALVDKSGAWIRESLWTADEVNAVEAGLVEAGTYCPGVDDEKGGDR